MTSPPTTTETAEFHASWLGLVRTWLTAATESRQAATAVLQGALDNGLEDTVPDTAELADPPVNAADDQRCAVALVRLSGAFDPAGYRANVPDRPDKEAPIVHYCRIGWRVLHNPSRDFDTWWYWTQYLDPTAFAVNPLVHYLLVGRRAGLLPLPPPAPIREATALNVEKQIRRVCLFAGYDADGIIDEYVVSYVRELSRFADVYYLCDGELQEGELAKLEGIAVGAWSIRHGTYDFGSYSRLARDLVGWDRIMDYDELLLVNDSAYLLRPLDDVFSRMEALACDWWGLQATKRDYEAARGCKSPIPLEDAKIQFRGERPFQQVMHLHVSSYFLALRRPAFMLPDVRRLLDNVVAQETKARVILTYELGLSRTLLESGFHFETYIDDLYPYHPLYTNQYFELVGRGFPLLKRNLLSENPRNAPDLADWKQRILAHLPDAPVEVFERNLLRVAADDKLQLSLSVVTDADGVVRSNRPIPWGRIEALDARTPVFDHWWAFPVCAYDHTFAGNERAVFEIVKDDPSIKKIVLTRSRQVTASGENVEVVPLLSRRGQELVVRAGHIFVKHTPRSNVPYPLSTTTHNFINLWHGIPLKRFGWAAVDTDEHRETLRAPHAGSRAVVTSSKVDSLAMAAAFYPLTLQDMWPTGLPRNDFVLCAEERLPADLREQEQQLREAVGGRRLVMFLPTFKDGQGDSYYRFSDAELARLGDWAQRHNAVIGVREHMADEAHTYSRMLAPLNPVDLSSRRFPVLEILYRAADALVTDYSSCLVDFMLTGRPVVSFAYDYDRYAREERGLFYDLEEVVPGPVARTFDQLAEALEDLFTERSPEQLEDYDWRRALFFDHVDDQNSWRVVQRVKGLYVSGA